MPRPRSGCATRVAWSESRSCQASRTARVSLSSARVAIASSLRCPWGAAVRRRRDRKKRRSPSGE
eukprot:7804354-Lingulodinium_polyedra.AAC.1